MSAVKDLISTLYRSHGIVAEFVGTGGGCMAVEVRFGNFLPGDDYGTRYRLLITNREDVFSGDDEISDAEVYGFYVGFYAYNDAGDYTTDYITIYQTPDGAGVSSGESARAWDEDGELWQVVNLPAEIVACADAVAFLVRVVQDADDTGRTETV